MIESWRKFKFDETGDFVVIGIAAPSDSTFGRAGLVLGAGAGDALRYVRRSDLPDVVSRLARILRGKATQDHQ